MREALADPRAEQARPAARAAGRQGHEPVAVLRCLRLLVVEGVEHVEP